ncbi:MAG TPA: histidine phosphatase family protein [Acidimicrobiales bacterium]
MLILVRHGRTALNAAGRLQGRVDAELDDVGVEQARRIAAAVSSAERVVSSPLLRARQTAEALGMRVEIDDRWIELDYGDLDGKPVAEVGAEVWAQWRVDLDYVPAGGESLAALNRRVVGACEELLPVFATIDLVVVSHVSPIKAAVAWALGAGAEVGWRSHLDQASITRIGVSGRGPILRSFNETTHLGVSPGPARISG